MSKLLSRDELFDIYEGHEGWPKDTKAYHRRCLACDGQWPCEVIQLKEHIEALELGLVEEFNDSGI